jgi:hypothetical protein
MASYFLIEPEHAWWTADMQDGNGYLPDGYEYRSDTNDTWLDSAELRRLLWELELGGESQLTPAAERS